MRDYLDTKYGTPHLGAHTHIRHLPFPYFPLPPPPRCNSMESEMEGGGGKRTDEREGEEDEAIKEEDEVKMEEEGIIDSIIQYIRISSSPEFSLGPFRMALRNATF